MKNLYSNWCYKQLAIFTRLLVWSVVLLFLQSGVPQLTRAGSPGSLDTTFGTGGTVITDFGDDEYASSIAVQADGKIVVAGRRERNYSNDFALARYNTDGTLDPSFGTGGKVTSDFGGSERVSEVAIQTDGKIIAAGNSGTEIRADFVIVRYNADGSLDQSFGTGGKVITVFAGGYSWLSGLAIQADGKIVAAGCSVGGFTLVRYNTDGTLDPSFGTGGIVTTIVLDGWGAVASAVAIQTDGKIVAVGAISQGYSSRFALVRYNTDGSLDASFDSDGKVVTQFDWGNAVAHAAAIQRDGKIVAAGTIFWGIPIFAATIAVVRYNTDGSLDPTWGSQDNAFTEAEGSGYVNGVAIQRNGKIVVAFFGLGSDQRWYFGLVRCNPDGCPDETFGNYGTVTTDFGDNTSQRAFDVAIQEDGKIVAAGNCWSNLYSDFALARFNGDSVRAKSDFDGDGLADISLFRPSDSVWYLNRSAEGFSATQFGLSTDKIVPADYDGDGRTDIAVFRDGTWYWLNSSNGAFNAVQFGTAGDTPVPADFTGDGSAELAVYRDGTWWTLNLQNFEVEVAQFGIASDLPVVADYDGDRRADRAVYRNGEWHLNQSSLGYAVVQFGLAADLLVVGDYDGDGKADPAVYRDGTWYLMQSTRGFAAFQWGLSGDIPAPADYDGDRRTDPTTFRNGTWYILQSSSGTATFNNWGLSGDIPIAAAGFQ